MVLALISQKVRIASNLLMFKYAIGVCFVTVMVLKQKLHLQM